jgi:hypothetical protein
MLLRTGQIIKGGQEGTDRLGNCCLALRTPVTLDTGSVVYKICLQSLQILEDLEFAID